jgi:hypothetical protein
MWNKETRLTVAHWFSTYAREVSLLVRHHPEKTIYILVYSAPGSGSYVYLKAEVGIPLMSSANR